MNFLLSFYCYCFLVHFSVKKKKKNSAQDCFWCLPCLAAGGQFQWVRDCKSKLNLNSMEEEQHSQQPMEGNPNSYRSMRDYRNPPRMSAPSYIVPPTNVPYSNTYDPSWRNHQNFSWAPRPPQYAPQPP